MSVQTLLVFLLLPYQQNNFTQLSEQIVRIHSPTKFHYIPTQGKGLAEDLPMTNFKYNTKITWTRNRQADTRVKEENLKI